LRHLDLRSVGRSVGQDRHPTSDNPSSCRLCIPVREARRLSSLWVSPLLGRNGMRRNALRPLLSASAIRYDIYRERRDTLRKAHSDTNPALSSASARTGAFPSVQVFLVDDTYLACGAFGRMGLGGCRPGPSLVKGVVPLEASERDCGEALLQELVEKYGRHALW
jgi:hypothetical protein